MMTRKQQDLIEYLSDTEPSTLEAGFLRQLAEAINGLGYVHRKKLRRKAGNWYEMTVTFQWPKNGLLDIDTLRVRETRAPNE